MGIEMLAALKEDMKEAFAEVSACLLLKVDLPDVYEGAIVATEVTNQEKVTYETIRSVNETQQSIENIKAKSLAQINIINSNASSRATMILNRGAGEVAKQNIEYTTLALKSVKDKLAFTTPKTSLMEYFFYQKVAALKDDTKNKMVVGKVNSTAFMEK